MVYVNLKIMNRPLISIIIPVYNSEAFLDKCIQSAINQSYDNIEVVLVDDGSIDSSGEICDTYAAIDSRIKIIHKKNGGLVSSRKAGLLISTGEYVLYIDGDDWIELKLVEDFVNEIVKYNADVIISAHIVNLQGREDILVNSIPPGFYNKERLVKEVYPQMLYTGKFAQFGIFTYSWGKMYRKEMLLQNQLNVDEDIIMGEDALSVYPTLLDVNSIVILKQPYYHYRQRADSLTKNLRRLEISKMQKVYDGLKNTFKQKGVLDIMLPQLQYYILTLLIINTQGPEAGDSSTPLYPFSNFEPNTNLVLYGGGTFGQHIYKKIMNHKNLNLLAWVDEKHKHYSKLNLPVSGFPKIKLINYNVVLIALIDEDNSNRAYSKLIQHGVSADKIVQIPFYNTEENIQEHLLKYQIKL